jgi:hypothetical protein
MNRKGSVLLRTSRFASVLHCRAIPLPLTSAANTAVTVARRSPILKRELPMLE